MADARAMPCPCDASVMRHAPTSGQQTPVLHDGAKGGMCTRQPSHHAVRWPQLCLGAALARPAADAPVQRIALRHLRARGGVGGGVFGGEWPISYIPTR
ncbi:hypothetical protein JHW43_003022 [Diplocarpon mali]|nr:hypothetical protein JHW43_003022 [Diplocarpon mali]